MPQTCRTIPERIAYSGSATPSFQALATLERMLRVHATYEEREHIVRRASPLSRKALRGVCRECEGCFRAFEGLRVVRRRLAPVARAGLAAQSGVQAVRRTTCRLR